MQFFFFFFFFFFFVFFFLGCLVFFLIYDFFSFFFFFFYDYILLRWIEIVIMKAVKTLHGHIHFFDIVIMKGSLIYRDSNHPHQAILNKKFDFNQKNYF